MRGHAPVVAARPAVDGNDVQSSRRRDESRGAGRPPSVHARLIALGLVTAVTVGTVAAEPRPRVASVDEDEDEDDDADDDDREEDVEVEDDDDQPPVTAGGLYTIATYPRSESGRPLSMTKDLLELELGVGVDATNANAFESAGAVGGVRYGLEDNVELRAGFWGIRNFSAWQVDAAVEGSIVYELVDLRVGLRLARTAETATIDAKGAPEQIEGRLKGSIPIGVPFRYRPKPQVAITALETAIAIDFDGPPDAIPSLAIVVQPAPVVALVIRASAAIDDFDFRPGNIVVPLSAAVQLTPNNRLDVGLELRFGNHDLPAGADLDDDGKADAFYDDRFLFLFARYRR